MRLLKSGRSVSPLSKLFRVVSGPEPDFEEMSRRIVSLVDAWLKAQEEPGSNSRDAGIAEGELHRAIKASPLYGKVLSFAGLNLWVNDRTSDGLVEIQESISL